jgi:hypothetical protein
VCPADRCATQRIAHKRAQNHFRLHVYEESEVVTASVLAVSMMHIGWHRNAIKPCAIRDPAIAAVQAQTCAMPRVT